MSMETSRKYAVVNQKRLSSVSPKSSQKFLKASQKFQKVHMGVLKSSLQVHKKTSQQFQEVLGSSLEVPINGSFLSAKDIAYYREGHSLKLSTGTRGGKDRKD